MSINLLPNELLDDCLAVLKWSRPDIRNLRLVSKKFHAAASPFLIDRAIVCLTWQSLQDLESISNHSIFSKSIKFINIDVSYYDGLLSNNFQRFADQNAIDLYQTLDWMDIADPSPSDPEEKDARAAAEQTLTEWQHMASSPSYVFPQSPSKPQRLLIAAYEEYVSLFKEQEKVLTGGGFVRRVAQAFAKMPILTSIVIEDYQRVRKPTIGRSRAQQLSDRGLRAKSLAKSRWKGWYRTALETKPPVHLISDIFSALARTDVRPPSFDIRITAPANMRHINLSDLQLDAVRKVLSRSESLYFRVERWARQDSMAGNNQRPAEELAGLCALTRAFFSSTKLKEMQISLDDYPPSIEIPQISVTNLITLPLASHVVSKVYFNSIPFTLDDLQTFITSTKETLTWLDMHYAFLLDGLWGDGLDVLRDLAKSNGGKLKYMEFQYPKGGEYGGRNKPKVAVDDFHYYIMGDTEKNPLQGWNENSGEP